MKLLNGVNLKLKADVVVRMPEQIFEGIHSEYVSSHSHSSIPKFSTNSVGAVDACDEYIQFLESCKQRKLLKAKDLALQRRHSKLLVAFTFRSNTCVK